MCPGTGEKGVRARGSLHGPSNLDAGFSLEKRFNFDKITLEHARIDSHSNGAWLDGQSSLCYKLRGLSFPLFCLLALVQQSSARSIRKKERKKKKKKTKEFREQRRLFRVVPSVSFLSFLSICLSLFRVYCLRETIRASTSTAFRRDPRSEENAFLSRSSLASVCHPRHPVQPEARGSTTRFRVSCTAGIREQAAHVVPGKKRFVIPFLHQLGFPRDWPLDIFFFILSTLRRYRFKNDKRLQNSTKITQKGVVKFRTGM